MRLVPALLAFALFAASFPSASSVAVLPERLVVVFETDVPSDLAAFVAPGEVVLTIGELAAAVVETTTVHAPTLLDRLRTRSDVVAADREQTLALAYTPDDARYAEQWAPPVVGLPAAWDHGLGGHDVVVALLDTGIDTDHPDLLPNRLAGGAACPADLNPISGGSVEDSLGHGTHVAGIAAAAIGNGVGVAGASNACIVSVKVCDGGCKPSAVAVGLVYVSTADVDIASMSFGWLTNIAEANEILLRRGIEFAYEDGVLLVAAAGNSACGSASTVSYPAAYPQVVAVTNLARPGTDLSASSSCGPETDLAAPGSEILSTYVGNGYQVLGGTSMAAPLVAGIAALVKHADPDANSTRVRCILETTADDLGAAGHDARFGHGRIDALEAVEVAKGIRPSAC